MEFLSGQDPEVGAAVRAEYDRQRRNIELIASENFVSEAVLAALTALLAAHLVRCFCRRDMRWWERLLLFPVAALCALLAAFFAAEAAPALAALVHLLFA